MVGEASQCLAYSQRGQGMLRGETLPTTVVHLGHGRQPNGGTSSMQIPSKGLPVGNKPNFLCGAIKFEMLVTVFIILVIFSVKSFR